MKARELDEMLGAPARLAIVATLARGQRLSFTALRRETGLADGNLHVQTRKLSAAGYLLAEKDREGARTVTRFELTEKGRLMFLEHVRRLQEAAEGPFGAGRGKAEPGPVAEGDRSRVW